MLSHSNNNKKLMCISSTASTMLVVITVDVLFRFFVGLWFIVLSKFSAWMYVFVHVLVLTYVAFL